MNASRFFLYGLILPLALLAVVVSYSYQRLPSLLEQQAEAYLYEYGVRDIRLGRMQVSLHQFSVDQLQVRGELDGMSFDVSMSTLEAGYDLLGLWRGGRPSLSLALLDLVVVQTAAAVDDADSLVVVSEMLPYTLLSELPLDELSVQHWRLSYQPLATAPITVAGSLRWAELLQASYTGSFLDNDLHGTLRAADRDSLHLTFDLPGGVTGTASVEADMERADAERWHWSVRGELHYTPLLALLRRLDDDADLALDLSVLEDLQASGVSQFEASINHPDELYFAAVTQQSSVSQLDAVVNFDSSISALAYADIVKELSGNFSTTLLGSGAQIDLTLGPAELSAKIGTVALQLPEDTRRWLRWEDSVPLRWRNPGEVRLVEDKPGVWSLQLRDNRLTIGDRNSQLNWDAANLDLLFDTNDAVLRATALSGRLDTLLRKKQLPQLQLSLTQQGSSDNSEFELQLGDTAQSLALSLQGKLNPSTGHGAYLADLHSIDLPYASRTLMPLLQKFDLLQQPVELVGGKFSITSELRSSDFSLDGLQQQAQLILEDLSGSYGEYGFEGVHLAASWKGIENWQTLQPVTFDMARMDVGFDIIDTHVQVVLPQATPLHHPVVTLEQFETGMFGGRVYLPEPRKWDFASASNSVTLRADDWRLADMVALQQGQDIHAQGMLEGELPITVTNGRIIIEHGYLRALAPGGRISYVANAASQALAASSAELGMAMDLLRDFQYQTLSSEVELDPQGNLLLGLSLAGSNPAQFEGRPIRFNINLEQNLDPLLQSLRLSDSLVDKVENRWQ